MRLEKRVSFCPAEFHHDRRALHFDREGFCPQETRKEMNDIRWEVKGFFILMSVSV